MATTADLNRRLERLGPILPARSVSVIACGHSSEEIDKALAQHGLSRSDPDVEFKVIVFEMLSPDGSIAPPKGDIRISITDNN